MRLHRALAEDRFCLYAQKIVSLQDEPNAVNYYEILLRLLDHRDRVILPHIFLSAAERYNLMSAIDCWVISNFMANYSDFRHNKARSYLSNSVFTINLSEASLNNKQFDYFLQEQLERFQIDPATICFEITETAAIANLSLAARFVGRLRQLGCSVALDKFGSGMNSLTYLETLPVDYLKIDGSLIKNMVTSKIESATVKYFRHIAQIMDLKIMAEFVENKAILQKLQEIGVDYAQGFAIAKPVPLDLIFD